MNKELEMVLGAVNELINCYKKAAETTEIIMKYLFPAAEEKTEAQAAQKTESEAQTAQQDQPEPKQETQPKTYDYQEVRGIVAKLSIGNKPAARELIAKYGATKLSEVKPENYAALVAEAEAMINA